MTTSDYNWLRDRLRVTTSDYKPGYKWLKVNTNDCKWLKVKLQMTATGIGNNLRHKDVDRLLWLHNNEQSKYVEKCSKNFATLPAKIIEKYLWCTSSHLQMFPKVSVFKKAFNTAVLLKRDSNTKMPFTEHILLENVCQCLHILKNWKPHFTFWKKERKENQWSEMQDLSHLLFRATRFLWSIEVLKHETKAMLTWVTKWLFVYYWFREIVKNWNQRISKNICLTMHKYVTSQGKSLEFWLLDTLTIEKLKLNEKVNL